MLDVSPRFLAALRETHGLAVAARVYPPGSSSPVEVKVLGGSLTADRDAQIRRSATLECALAVGDAFALELVRELPFGGWAVIERGIRYADGALELLQLGYFRVESVEWSELQGRATLTLADRMAQVVDERFLKPLVGLGHPSEIIEALVRAVFGSSIAYHIGTDPALEAPLTDATIYEEDRAQAIADLAAAADAEAYFDAAGDFVLEPRVRESPVVWTIDAGERGTLIAASETLDRSSVRNGVLVRGQETAKKPPITGRATDEDPSSPTRWGGPFGRVPLISSSTAVASKAQADSKARSLLNLRLGLQRSTTLVAVPNPALEPGDAVEIITPDGRSEIHTINALTFGLEADADVEITTTSQYRPVDTRELVVDQAAELELEATSS